MDKSGQLNCSRCAFIFTNIGKHLFVSILMPHLGNTTIQLEL